MFNKQNTLRSAFLRILCAGLILCLSGLVIQHKQSAPFDQTQYSIRVVAPTCVEKGYSLYTNLDTGEVVIRDLVAAKGHVFDAWTLLEQGDEVNCGFSERTCEVCNLQETRAEYPELSIPKILLYGSLDGIGKKTEVPMEVVLELKEPSISIECFATLKHQGHISISYEKKNYTLKLFQDENRQIKNTLELSHWNPESKYILKANYVDTSQCRNLICADIWADMCATRASVPKELKELSNYGAVDGWPVAVYLNDVFHGLFNMNLHKDDDLFSMKKTELHAIMISNHGQTPEATFHAEAVFNGNSPWEVEFCGTEDSTWAKENFNALIRFVMTSDDATFRKNLHLFLDVDAAIDYLIAAYALGLINHADQDLVMVTYGDVWIPTLYDMETAFGLQEDGAGWFNPTEQLPLYSDSTWDSGTGNLLWDRLMQNYFDEICDRYKDLRMQILDPQALCERVTAFTDGIPTAIYDAEENTNPAPISYKEHIKQILQYIPQRITNLDQIFLEGIELK